MHAWRSYAAEPGSILMPSSRCCKNLDLTHGACPSEQYVCGDLCHAEPGSILMPQLKVLMLSKDALTNLQFLR